MDRAEAAARARTRTIPDGVYEAESSHGRRRHRDRQADPDPRQGDRQGRRDDRSTSPTSRSRCAASTIPASPPAMPARRSPTSASPRRPTIRSTTARSAASRSSCRQGRIVSAKRPAPMRLWMTFPMTIVDTDLQGAGAGDPGPRHRRPSCRSPDRAVPRHQPKTSEFFIGNFGPLGGGWGAKKTEDGVSARSRSTTATPTTARTSRPRRNSRSWSSAMS